jgi:hypothetical protein
MEYQKKALPFITLFLGCLSPFINLAAINTNDLLVIFPDIIKYFICLFSGSILIALLLYKLLSRRLALHMVCNCISVFIVFFFMYYSLSHFLDRQQYILGLHGEVYQILAWAFVTTFMVWATYRLTRKINSASLVPFALLFFLTIPIIKVLSYVSSIPSTFHNSPLPQITAKIKDPNFSPNVYFFILDQHIRGDVSKTLYDADYANFNNQLADRGFYVADKALSNYDFTKASIPSTFNMGYPYLPNQKSLLPGQVSYGLLPLFHSQNKNVVVNIFKELGYNFYLADGIIDFTGCKGLEDVCIPGTVWTSYRELTTILIDMTVLDDLKMFFERLGYITAEKKNGSSHINFTVPELTAIEAFKHPKPLFLFSHILPPHAPYRVWADCGPIRKSFSRADLDKHTPNKDNDIDAWRLLYKNQMFCVQNKMIEGIDTILKVDQNAIIIIQGDHGAKSLLQSGLPFNKWSKSQFIESFGILNALRLPESVHHLLHPSISPVNTFRLVFSAITTEQFDMLEDKSFYVDRSDKANWKIIPAP